MVDRVVVTFCTTCLHIDGSLAAALADIRHEYRHQVSFVEVDCLDACADYPAVSVAGRLVLSATPERLRSAIQYALGSQQT